MTSDPREAVERALERLGDDPWNAFLSVDAPGARERAAHLAREGRAGRPLWGEVVSIKDNLAVRGLRMTCGSRHLEGYVAPYSATVVERLEAAGAIVLGKTNLDEFGCGSSGENSAFGPTRNPRSPRHVPGGSSSGAGASVAAGVVPMALGSDTGGSARCPASFCGVVGFKPSNGLVSRHGLADLAMSLESPAPLARSVLDVARVLAAIAGSDPRDPRTVGSARPDPVSAVEAAEGAAEGLRVGVIREFFEGVAPDVAAPARAALAALQRRGASLVDVSVPSVPLSLPAYYLVCYSEFASAMQKLDGFRYGFRGAGKDADGAAAEARAKFGPEVKRRVLLGTFTTSREERSRWYETALAARQRIAGEFARAFEAADVLVGPTMPFRAFELGARIEDPLQLYAADVLTVSANLAGVPAGSVPLKVEGLPVGLQVLGPVGEDAKVLQVMRLVERLSGVVA